MARVDVSNEEPRTVRDAMRELNRMVDQLERAGVRSASYCSSEAAMSRSFPTRTRQGPPDARISRRRRSQALRSCLALFGFLLVLMAAVDACGSDHDASLEDSPARVVDLPG